MTNTVSPYAPSRRSLIRGLRTFLLVVIAFSAQACSVQDDKMLPAVPIEPIGAITNAFKSHDIVALDEGDHGNEQGHAFRLALIRDPRFAAVVDDIVVEFGNAMYQETMDRFIRGEDVPERELRRVWQDTTVATPLWDRPIYEEFYRAVRDVNAKLPSDHQLRVLLGDSPIDWSKVTGPQDFLKIEGRDSHPAGVIQREVLSKKRRALVIYGGLHFIRKQFEFPMNDEALAEELYKSPTHSIVGRLESLTTPAKVFSISTHTYGDLKNLQSDIGSWSPPVLVIIRNTSWGRAPFFAFYPVDDGGALYVRNPDGSPGAKLMPDRKRIPSMQDQVDAVLYLGPPEAMTYSRLTRKLCNDAEYLEMRAKRLSISEMLRPPGEPRLDPAEYLRQKCAEAKGSLDNANSNRK